MTFNGKTITIFGGTGFLGRHIVWALAKTGATIRVATRSPQHAYFLRPAGTVGQIVPVFCNIRDDASVAAVLKGATHAVNLVGILNQSGRDTFYRLHVEAAERIAKAARANDVRLLVHVSALGASLDAPSKYSQSKAQGENKVIHAFPRSVILRPSIIFGPEDSFFNKFAAMARISPCLPLIGGGLTKFQPVYVGDIAKAVRNILEDPAEEKFHGQIYEFGGPKTYTFRELMETLKNCTHQDVFLAPVPVPLAKAIGAVGGLLPGKPLTVDNVRSLSRDNVIQPGTPGLRNLGVEPTGLEAILPTYLSHYRPG
ncbi:MAG: complex I NDUFA9 subunit family protein, partial [Alphaproteobacteria bacterium]